LDPVAVAVVVVIVVAIVVAIVLVVAVVYRLVPGHGSLLAGLRRLGMAVESAEGFVAAGDASVGPEAVVASTCGSTDVPKASIVSAEPVGDVGWVPHG
jgi:hypothetical protein